uniref:RRM domain-containing protein n=1 Tax=Setaria digitata TaxID=48799 RepID=A0A915PXN7_9BILA
MSRLIVKGLPSNCNEEKLRNHFKSYGEITDCTLKYTKDGVFRRFAFLGYATDESAQKAREHLHNTFMGASRLLVEECKPFGDESKPRAWSKYTKESSAYKRLHPEDTEKKNQAFPVNGNSPPIKKMRDEKEKGFYDFIEVQKGSVPIASSSNDENTSNLMEELLSGISGDTSLSLIIRGLPKTVKTKGLKDWFSPIKLKGMKVVRGSAEAIAFVSFFQGSDVRKALQRNEQFLGGFKLEISKVPATLASEGNVEDYIYKTKEAETEAFVGKILETGRLFVRNLPYTCSDKDLQYLFKKYGEISELQVIVSKKTGQCKGFAIITYVFPESAVAAFSALDGSIFKGRMLHILPGDEKRVTEEKDIVGNSAFQKAKIAKLKKNAGKAHSWNTLFLGANAVAETLAEKLDVEKSDLLLGEGETSAGVRLALAETRLVRETREYLLANGVCLDVFSRPATKRSNTVIIVKNLTAKVDTDELKRMFARHGPVKQILMPPEGVTAIVEMENSVDAQKAFTALAYSRFRTQPLFLEWAPYHVFGSGKSENEDKDDDQKQSNLETPKTKDNELSAEEKKKLRRSKKHRLVEEVQESNEKVESLNPITNEETAKCEGVKQQTDVGKNTDQITNENQNDETEEQDDGLLPGTTLFVKNLNFNTTEEGLKNKFESHFRIRSATISKKRDTTDPTVVLSMGFGFITFYRPEDAQQALKEMQGILLDGHCLMLKLSHREIVADKTIGRKGVDKLEQGEATKVGASAEGHRGFGFVDFLTRADARRAFDALVHSTHFYGRRLVLEWAKPDSSLEELREKAVANLSGNRGEARLQKKMMKKIEQDLTVIDDD